jgi:hypothetical protein
MNKKHTYQLAIYTDSGQFIKKACVTSDIDLTGILREGLFIHNDIHTHIGHVMEIATN